MQALKRVNIRERGSIPWFTFGLNGNESGDRPRLTCWGGSIAMNSLPVDQATFGGMLAFMRKKFAGSYLALSAVRRSHCLSE